MNIAALESGGAIAALLFRRVGDSLLATPALRALKARYPKSAMIVLCEAQVRRVFEGLDYIDKIACLESSSSLALANALRAIPNLAATIDFLSDPRSALASAMGGASVRVGFAKSLRRIMYTHRVAVQDGDNPIYSAAHKLKLAEALGAHSENVLPDFVLFDENRSVADKLFQESNLRKSQTAAFFITSRREYKRWPLDRFIEIVNAVQSELELLVTVIGGENERSVIEEFCKTANLPSGSAVHFSNIGDMAAFLSNCKLYIGNDGGPKHLAVAVGIPTVTIFQNDPWEYWTPPESSRHVAIGGKSQSPSIEDVKQAVVRMLCR